MLTVALMLQAAPVAAANPEPYERARPLSRGPHPSPPTGAELDRLIALNDQAPVDELEGDVTAMVVTHTVYVKIAVDEEWRDYYGQTAFTPANSAIESADNAMYTEFGVNLVKYQTAYWDSSPDSGDVDACDLLNDLAADLNPGTSDVLIGFAKNYSNNYGGCAELNGDEAEVNWDSGSYGRWVRTQHEVSHLYGLPDRYPDSGNMHRDDVMENAYTDPSFWCQYFNMGDGDWQIFHSMADKFDS
jgi:hypothetical protein